MFEPDATLKQVMNGVVLRWGTAAPLYDLTAVAGWNAQWLPVELAAKAHRAAQLMAEGAAIIEEIEKATAVEPK